MKKMTPTQLMISSALISLTLNMTVHGTNSSIVQSITGIKLPEDQAAQIHNDPEQRKIFMDNKFTQREAEQYFTSKAANAGVSNQLTATAVKAGLDATGTNDLHGLLPNATAGEAKAFKYLKDGPIAAPTDNQIRAADYLMHTMAPAVIARPTEHQVKAADHLMHTMHNPIAAPNQEQVDAAEDLMVNVGAFAAPALNAVEAAVILRTQQGAQPALALTQLHVDAVISANDRRAAVPGGTASVDVRRHVAWAIQNGFGTQVAGTIPNGVAQATVLGNNNVQYVIVWKQTPGANWRAAAGNFSANGKAASVDDIFTVEDGQDGAAAANGQFAVFSNIVDSPGGGHNLSALNDFVIANP